MSRAPPRRIERPDQERAFFGALERFRVGPGHGKDDPRAFQHIGAAGDLRSGGLELGVAHRGALPGPALHGDFGAQPDQLFHGLGNRGATGLPGCGLLEHSDFHRTARIKGS